MHSTVRAHDESITIYLQKIFLISEAIFSRSFFAEHPINEPVFIARLAHILPNGAYTQLVCKLAR